LSYFTAFLREFGKKMRIDTGKIPEHHQELPPKCRGRMIIFASLCGLSILNFFFINSTARCRAFAPE
jgi:hypothetical protein